MIDRYYKIRHVAERWGVAQSTIYRLVASNELGCIKIGSAIRVREEDLAEYEKSHLCPAQSSNDHAPGSPGADD